jgi:ribosomal protein S27AE
MFTIPIIRDSIRKTALGLTCNHDMSVLVECHHCNASFPASSLKYDYYIIQDKEEKEYVEESNTVCPKCGHWNCCRIVYELLDNVIDPKLIGS